jgi:hypothetical protein
MPNNTQWAPKEKSAIRRGSKMHIRCAIALSDKNSRGKSNRLALVLVKVSPLNSILTNGIAIFSISDSSLAVVWHQFIKPDLYSQWPLSDVAPVIISIFDGF